MTTPDPTTSTFLYWINTNRMGTATKINKNVSWLLVNCFFCNVFILKKHFFNHKKRQIYTCELVHNLKWARQNDSMHFRYSGNFYLTVLQKEQHKKYIMRNNTKNMQHFLQPRFSEEQVRKKNLLTALFFF